jgi:hypothetical protein
MASVSGGSEERDGEEVERELQDALRKLFSITRISTNYVTRFKTTQQRLRIEIHAIDPQFLLDHNLNTTQFIDLLFREIFDEILRDVSESDFIGITLASHTYAEDLYLPFQLRREFSIEQILALILKLSQSDKHIDIYSGFQIVLSHVSMPTGSGRPRYVHSQLNFEKWLKAKRSVITIENVDIYCLSRVLVTILAKFKNEDKYKKTRNDPKYQLGQALMLHGSAMVQYNTPAGLREIQGFQKYLKKISDYSFRTY